MSRGCQAIRSWPLWKRGGLARLEAHGELVDHRRLTCEERARNLERVPCGDRGPPHVVGRGNLVDLLWSEAFPPLRRSPHSSRCSPACPSLGYRARVCIARITGLGIRVHGDSCRPHNGGRARLVAVRAGSRRSRRMCWLGAGVCLAGVKYRSLPRRTSRVGQPSLTQPEANPSSPLPSLRLPLGPPLICAPGRPPGGLRTSNALDDDTLMESPNHFRGSAPAAKSAFDSC